MKSSDQKRTQVIIIGCVIALGLALVMAMVLSANHKNEPLMNTAPTGLQVQVGEAPSVAMQKSLRCFVKGEFVGQFSLAECAKKNGVAAQSLDVGLDDNGQPTAAPTASLAPPPVRPIADPVNDTMANGDVEGSQTEEVIPKITSTAKGPLGACLRFLGGEWHQLKSAVTVGQCVQILYDTRCERPGSAAYGRWSNQTLRLVPGRVEISDDNENFRTFIEQGKGCSVAPR